MQKQFTHTGQQRVERSKFNLSYEKIMSADMGKIYPVLAEECIPGDVFKIGNRIVIRMQPLVAPILHDIKVQVHYFFVPYRILMDQDLWIAFITGGKDGTDTSSLDTWTPTGSYSDKGSLWDYFGFPITATPGTPIALPGTEPLAFPLTAYNRIWNYYYRDENLQTERLDTDQTIALRNWEKDYFTASMPWTQRGTPASVQLSGSASAVWEIDTTFPYNDGAITYPASGGPVNVQIPGNTPTPGTTDAFMLATANQATNLKSALDKNTIDMSTVGTFDIRDLRLMAQIQRFQELNARAGVRLPEFLKAQYGVTLPDYKIQEPEYIGGTSQPIIISEVLQTSETGTTPQGTLTGHGISAQQGFAGKYRCQEHGVVMGLMTIMPRAVYQQGVNRQWLRETRYDFPMPMFANLSEQEVLQVEIFATHNDQNENETIFGYIGRYDELRVKQNMVCGDMRDTYDYWHISRQFSTAPLLNSSFLECDPRKDIMAAPAEDAFIVQFGNIVTAVRPIPYMSNPGKLDH